MREKISLDTLEAQVEDATDLDATDHAEDSSPYGTISKSPAIEPLQPDQIAIKLHQSTIDGTINQDTLVVWGIDNTLIKMGSDYLPSGVKPIYPTFAKIIRTMQKKGVMNIAITSASPFDNSFEIKNEILRPISIPKIAKLDTYPSYFKRTRGSQVTLDELRIAGLKHIGIDFTSYKWRKFSKSFDCTQYEYNMENGGKELLEIISRHGCVKTWVDADDRKEYCHIQLEAILPGFEPYNQKRHFIQNDDRFSEILCIPIFSHGIIFCNFINFYSQWLHGFIKGVILRSFLRECKETIDQKFSNVVFIDYIPAYVKNVIEVMASIDMPCTGINIILYRPER